MGWRPEIPILGINTGHLGFLASYSLEETEELVDVVACDKGVIEKRALLEIRCEAMPEGFWPYALNEVAVLRGETASTVTVHAEVDGYFSCRLYGRRACCGNSDRIHGI